MAAVNCQCLIYPIKTGAHSQFDVPVGDAQRVHVIDAAGNLCVVELCLLLRNHALLGAELAEVAAVGQLHEEVEAVAVA